MKKLIFLILSLAIVSSPCYVYGAAEWNKSEVAGTRSVSDIDYYIGQNNSALDRLLANYNTITLSHSSAAQLTASIGEVVCSNSDGSARKMRQNTAATTITWADIDTGSEAASTTYYIFAIADADATTATFKITTSSTSPTGVTYYKKIGSFYNDASSNITNIHSVKTVSLGAFTAKTAGTIYQALTDGFVVGNTYTAAQGNGFIAYTDASSSPSTVIQRGHTLGGLGETWTSVPISFPVKQGNYYQVVGHDYLYATSNGQIENLYFIPLAINGGN